MMPGRIRMRRSSSGDLPLFAHGWRLDRILGGVEPVELFRHGCNHILAGAKDLAAQPVDPALFCA